MNHLFAEVRRTESRTYLLSESLEDRKKPNTDQKMSGLYQVLKFLPSSERAKISIISKSVKALDDAYIFESKISFFENLLRTPIQDERLAEILNTILTFKNFEERLIENEDVKIKFMDSICSFTHWDLLEKDRTDCLIKAIFKHTSPLQLVNFVRLQACRVTSVNWRLEYISKWKFLTSSFFTALTERKLLEIVVFTETEKHLLLALSTLPELSNLSSAKKISNFIQIIYTVCPFSPLWNKILDVNSRSALTFLFPYVISIKILEELKKNEVDKEAIKTLNQSIAAMLQTYTKNSDNFFAKDRDKFPLIKCVVIALYDHLEKLPIEKLERFLHALKNTSLENEWIKSFHEVGLINLPNI